MAGNVAEWTMTIRPIPNTEYEGPVVKAESIKDSIPPYWYYNIVACESTKFFFATPTYIGFRPVRDEWQRTHWQGFHILRETSARKNESA